MVEILLGGAALAAELPFRLPAGVAPTAYRLELVVDTAAEGFSGEVEIAVTLEAPQQEIWLHAQELEILSATATDERGAVAASFAEEGEGGIALFRAERPLGPGPATLTIRYAAPYRAELDGFYKVSEGGRAYVYSDFEPLDARRAFPSFDEPRFKTPFDIAVTVSGADLAVSNAPLQAEEVLADGRRRLVFATTEPLPTYLVALAVGEFDVVAWADVPPNEVRDAPLPLRGIAPKGEGAGLTYALEITAPLLAILERYFDSPYPYAKLDLVAPLAFGPSGMENAGAIFYRRDRILIGDAPSLGQQRSFAGLHAHELAHNWFGNLVTPAWWDDIWLNEAFATWMADRVMHLWRPDDFDDRGPLRGGRWAMWSDRLAGARQIRQPVLTPGEVFAAFDDITYSKGGAVLSMIERYMGAEAFRDGVRQYMAAHRFGVATAEDFHAALSASGGDPAISRAFRSFLEQPGAPMVALDWDCAGDGTVALTLSQSRSLPLGSRGEAGQVWSIPLCLLWPEGEGFGEQCLMLEAAEAEVVLPTAACPAWVHGNGGGAAYLDFTQPEAAWRALIADLHRLPPAEALSAVASLGAAFDAGLVGSELLLEGAEAAARSPTWDVVKAPMQDLRDWKNFVVPARLEAAAMARLREIYRPALEGVTLDAAALRESAGESGLARLRDEVLWFLALDADDPELHALLAGLGRSYLGFGEGAEPADGALHPELLHADLVQLALVAAAEEGGAPFAARLIERLKATEEPVPRGQLVYALGFMVEPETRALLWALILGPELPERDAAQLLRRLGHRVPNAEALFDWIVANYPALERRLSAGTLGWLPWRTSALCTRDARDRVEAFFAPRLDAYRGGERTLAQVLEAIELCAGVAEAQGPGAAALLEGPD